MAAAMYKSKIPGAVPIKLSDLQWARRKGIPAVNSLILHGDVWERIMRDSNDPIQPCALVALKEDLSAPQMRALLDWMAQEYAGCLGWLDYGEREIAKDRAEHRTVTACWDYAIGVLSER